MAVFQQMSPGLLQGQQGDGVVRTLSPERASWHPLRRGSMAGCERQGNSVCTGNCPTVPFRDRCSVLERNAWRQRVTPPEPIHTKTQTNQPLSAQATLAQQACKGWHGSCIGAVICRRNTRSRCPKHDRRQQHDRLRSPGAAGAKIAYKAQYNNFIGGKFVPRSRASTLM